MVRESIMSAFMAPEDNVKDSAALLSTQKEKSNVTDMSSISRSQLIKQLGAVAAGNIMEWYDFAVFGAMIDLIAGNFFPPPSDDDAAILPFLSTLIVYGHYTNEPTHELSLCDNFFVFAAGSAFIMRPIGGMIMGAIGDSRGSKSQLETSVLLMLIPTLILSLLPTYDQIGILATVCLVIIRLCQGTLRI